MQFNLFIGTTAKTLARRFEKLEAQKRKFIDDADQCVADRELTIRLAKDDIVEITRLKKSL